MNTRLPSLKNTKVQPAVDYHSSSRLYSFTPLRDSFPSSTRRNVLLKKIIKEEDDCRETFHYFDDGKRRIDHVIAYSDDGSKEVDTLFDNYLYYLEEKLGLEIETGGSVKKKTKGVNNVVEDNDDDVHFIKIHAPIQVLYHLAEDLKMKMPTKLSDISMTQWYENNAAWNLIKKIDPFELRDPQTTEAKDYFVALFDTERLPEFINHADDDLFFPPALRGRLVHYLLDQAKFGGEPLDIGIDSLIHRGVFLDAYALHDGPTLRNKEDKPVNQRQRLQKDWASINCLFRYQPINAIKDYFGEKVALYFSWLGFYTMFLIPAAIVGVLCFLYGLSSSFTTPAVLEACSDKKVNGTHLFYMCPLCDKQCSYYLLSSTCLYAKVSNVFDNEMTLVFAVFMSIWATLFLEFWKRNQICLAYQWRSLGFEVGEEQMRPEYIASNLILKINPVTLTDEPHMPKRARIRRLIGAVSVVAFFGFLVVIAVIGVVVFRAVMSVIVIASDFVTIRERSKVIVATCAGVLNLLAISLLKFIYQKVAVILTDWENPRTPTDYEDSFTVKMFLFTFVNTYSSIFYVAFFKTQSVTGHPGKYKRFSSQRFRLDGCSAQGCFLELTIQIVIIMVGKQFVNNCIETAIPTILKWWKDKKAKKKITAESTIDADKPQWVDDYEGEMQTKFSLFWEYQELVVQYGFVSMFVAGFSLAPLCALLNNIIEIRVDAYNYISNSRRPVAQRAEDIGAWYKILATLTSMSVVINAFVLAFTSNLIPLLLYQYTDSVDGSTSGYIDWSLSTINVDEFTEEERPINATAAGIPEQDQCRYPGYRETSYPYKRTLTYWMILSARLSFVLCFVIFVIFVKWFISYVIPDIPHALKMTMQREKYLASQADKDHKVKLGKRGSISVSDPVRSGKRGSISISDTRSHRKKNMAPSTAPSTATSTQSKDEEDDEVRETLATWC